ncbi:hypothetical protein EI171_23630 [Bradyrhizobium sp. LCT2]|uniref:hypothetical protein n=1 Tax=Bradyrhizobium sp. LCT2 TaxID=2493093 RepID=UPI0013744010|nr:hypothetical protein [Bradyrhizobium sp. LCT2]QHP70021.1 hypothetical protein EI171_23630 [Bradyrhizobium sp. LCT2]
MKVIASLLAAGYVVTSAPAIFAAEGDRMVYGAGMVTCAEWQQYRSTGNNAATLQVQAWIDGFLSGYNSASSAKDFISPKPESVAYYAWIDNYCIANPLNRVAEAAVGLKAELSARAR